MSRIFGIWKLDTPILCKKEISGKEFKSRIGDMDVQFCFPSCPEIYNADNEKSLNGDLIAPLGAFEGELDWGTIHQWPEGLFSVNYLMCLIIGDDVDYNKIYTDFLAFREKFCKLRMIDDGDFIEPEQKIPSLLQNGNGVYDGLVLFRTEEGKVTRLKNSRRIETIKAELVNGNQYYDISKMEMLFSNAGSEKNIAFPYELLIVAYRAVLRYDFRSATIIGGTAIEEAILHRIEKHYNDNNMNTFETDKDEKIHKTLGNKFSWLNKLKIEIPIKDYFTEIVHVRNSVTHDGKDYSFNSTKRYLDNCLCIIREYCPDVLEE